MVNSIGFSASEMLSLQSDVSLNNTSSFNAQEAYENTFEDILLEKTTENQKNLLDNTKKPFINIEIENIIQIEQSSNQNNSNQNFSTSKGFESINFKNAINKYMLESFK